MTASTDRPLRIAVVAACPFPYPRGTPVRIHRLSCTLAGRGHDVRVFTYHLGNPREANGLAVHRIPNVVTYRRYAPGPTLQKLLVVDPLLAGKLFAGLIGSRVDVIHAHHYEGLLTARLARIGRRIPVVYDAHTLLGSELAYFRLAGLPSRTGGRIGRRLDRWLPRLSDHVISVTPTIKQKLVGYGMPEQKITVVVNGVEHEIFDESLALPRASSAAPQLIFTGNMAAYQGIEHLLRAFARLVEQRKDARLLLVTDSSFDPYEELARELGIRSRIDLDPAPFPEHPRLLARAAIALNPRTDCDGIPQKLLNYMAAGRPTVSFEGSAPCIEHGKTGWTVPNGDTEAFAGAILKLLEQPELAERLGRCARETIRAHYTWDVAAAKAEAVFRRLVGVSDGRREESLERRLED